MANMKTYTIKVRGANLKPSAIKICMDSQKMVANLIAELKELSVSVHPYYHYSSPIVPGLKLVLRIGGEDGFELQEDDVLCDVVKDTRNEQLFTIVELMESEPKRRPGPHWLHPKATCEDDEDSPG